MEFTAQQIAQLLNGKVEGDPGAKVNNLSKIDDGKPNTISFLANPQYTPHIYSTAASVVIVNDSFVPEKPLQVTLIRVPDAYGAFATLLETYNQIRSNKQGIEQPSFIHPTARIGSNVYIGAFAYVGEMAVVEDNARIYPHAFVGDNARVGEGSTLFSGVKLYHDCVVGKKCVIHANTVIGADGFGFAPNQGTEFKKVPQIGNVIIEDNVEVGANTAIDRATLGSTIIRRGVKLDNLIQIAHNVEIGENTVIAGQTGVAGSSKVGKNCMIAAQVGIVGHIQIADGVKIAGQSGIGSSIEKEGEIVQGSPAFGIGDYKRSYVLFRKLPDIQQRLSALEKNQEKK